MHETFNWIATLFSLLLIVCGFIPCAIKSCFLPILKRVYYLNRTRQDYGNFFWFSKGEPDVIQEFFTSVSQKHKHGENIIVFVEETKESLISRLFS